MHCCATFPAMHELGACQQKGLGLARWTCWGSTTPVTIEIEAAVRRQEQVLAGHGRYTVSLHSEGSCKHSARPVGCGATPCSSVAAPTRVSQPAQPCSLCRGCLCQPSRDHQHARAAAPQATPPLQENIGRLNKCVEGGKDVQACALGDFDRLQQLVKGMYSLFLPAWLASYPPSHLLVLNFDDYRWVLPPP